MISQLDFLPFFDALAGPSSHTKDWFASEFYSATDCILRNILATYVSWGGHHAGIQSTFQSPCLIPRGTTRLMRVGHFLARYASIESFPSLPGVLLPLALSPYRSAKCRSISWAPCLLLLVIPSLCPQVIHIVFESCMFTPSWLSTATGRSRHGTCKLTT